MSQESLEQFMEKVGSNEELRATIESQLDSDGQIAVDALIVMGAENGCEFTVADLQECVELSDRELDEVAGGSKIDTVTSSKFDALKNKINSGYYDKEEFRPVKTISIVELYQSWGK